MCKKFDMKVTTIEEAQDLSIMKVYEFVGSLQTFEIVIGDRYENKNKNISFLSNSGEDEDQTESLSYVIALIERKFNTSLRRMDKQWRTNFQDKRPDINSQSKSKYEDKPN